MDALEPLQGVPEDHPRLIVARLFQALSEPAHSEDSLRAFVSDPGLIAYFLGLRAGAPECVLRLQDVFADADKVLALFQLEHPAQRPTGKGGAILCRVERGKITEYWPVPDMEDV